MNTLFFRHLSVIVFAGLIVSGFAGEVDGVRIFSPQDIATVSTEEVRPKDLQPSVLRARPITLVQGALSPDLLSVGTLIEAPAFADAVFRARVDRVITDINHTLRIRARLEDDPDGVILLTMDRDRVFGVIEQPARARKFLIRPIGGRDAHVVEEVDPAREDVLPCGQCQHPCSHSVSDRTAPLFHDMPPVSVTSGTGAEIDVMILYTSAARDWANSWAGGINSSIAQAMERAQLVVDNSDVDLTFNLVHAALVNYEESGDAGTDLTRLTVTDDGHMDEIHGWRDDYGADLVALFTLEHDVGGVAWQLDWKPGAQDKGFSVTRIQQAHNTYTHIHEMGHNMGLHHRKDQPYQPGPTEWWADSWPENTWSAGWRWIGTNGIRYCSVMSYNEEWGGSPVFTVAHFSSPDVIHQGQPTGHAQDGDNVWTLRETKHVVAGYREAVRRMLRITGDLHFGEVVTGQSAQRTLTLHNDGTDSLTVSGMAWPTDFSGEWAGVVSAEQSQVVTVTFSPSDSSFYCGAVEVLSDASGGNPWHTLSGYGDSPAARSVAVTNPVSGTMVSHQTEIVTVSGTAGADITGHLVWSNSLTGATGQSPAGTNWQLESVPLNTGSNWIHLRGTNQPPPTFRASDSAGQSAYGGGWENGSNGGFGFEPWTLTRYGDNGGFFRGASDIGSQSWGMWANSGDSGIDDSTVVAVRPLDHSLAPSNTFLVKFQNKWIQGNKSVGFALQNAQGEYLFEFMFIGGRQAYTINDRQTGRDSGIGYTDQGLHLAFDLTGPDTYRLRTGAHTFTGELAQRADMRIGEFRAWNYSAGPGSSYDFFINDLAVTNAPLATVFTTAETLIVRERPTIEIHPGGAEGLVLSWPVMESGSVGLFRSTNLLLPNSGFLFFTNLPYGQNMYTVTVHEAEGSAYYRIQVEP